MDVMEIPFALWSIVLPLAAGTLAVLLGGHRGPLAGMVVLPGIVLAVIGLTWQVVEYGPRRYPLAGWVAPLGIELYADGLSALMLIMTAVVSGVVTIYALGYFADQPKSEKATHAAKERESFWPLWLFLWAALNALFLSADIFNLYVTLELVTLSAVALVGLTGTHAALHAALRYLVLAVLGSLAYLLGLALLYAAYGTLDLALLERALTPGSLPVAAITLITVGLLLKTALFPLHFWLPPAHSNAPAPVSAVLSSLVVTGSFYLLLRLWFQVFPAALLPGADQFLGILGAIAIVWGSLQAVTAQRLKLLIAYSTVAQLGYLFLLFPLAGTNGLAFTAWGSGVFFAFSHACAKAAMFLAAGVVLQGTGHDRIAELDGAGQRLPMTFLTMSLAGVTLMGLPPSGTFVAKWMLVEVALTTGQGWLAVVIIGGGLLAALYLFRVLGRAFSGQPLEGVQPVPRGLEWAALSLALAALLLGFLATPILDLLSIGAPLTDNFVAEAMP